MTEFSELTDAELVELMVSGNEKAFAEIYGRKQPAIFRFAIHMSGSRSTAEDATQEAFLTFIENAQMFNSNRGSLSAFLFGIARKHVLRLLHKRPNSKQMIQISEDQEGIQRTEILISSDDPLNHILRGKTIEVVRNAILTLPPKYREVVVLCDLNEFSYEEAALMIHVRVGTIRSRLHRARALLLRKLTGNETSAEPSNDPAGGKSYELSAF
jgi:RNA polymerase sigma-70 factor (ECF subfamily)